MSVDNEGSIWEDIILKVLFSTDYQLGDVPFLGDFYTICEQPKYIKELFRNRSVSISFEAPLYGAYAIEVENRTPMTGTTDVFTPYTLYVQENINKYPMWE